MNDQPLVVYLPPESLEQCSHWSRSRILASVRHAQKYGHFLVASRAPQFIRGCRQRTAPPNVKNFIGKRSTSKRVECTSCFILILFWAVNRKTTSTLGKADRIDIGTFYPLLAVLTETARFKPTHSASTHRIAAPPAIVGLPDGSASKVVELDPEIHMDDAMSERWWSTTAGATDQARRKLFARLCKEGEVLPIVTYSCLGLLAIMYTTISSRGSRSRRIRLQYKSCPISDFGIAKGSVDVKCQDQPAYFDGNTCEEIILDVGMFTFNFCTMVSAAPYISDLSDFPPVLDDAPAFFCDRPLAKIVIQLHTGNGSQFLEMRSWDGLFDTVSRDLRPQTVSSSGEFLNDFGEGNIPSPDERLSIVYTLKNLNVLREALRKRTWTK
ncbi:hypothetical protein DFS33DRAFT_1382207 [Desarmillaria ectypa]|nr:hypothetical protein DFS33DRAFT_1382207 [Desarmillaria ectypa]